MAITYDQLVARDAKAFEKTARRYFTQVFARQSDPHILVAACGACNELLTLLRIAGPQARIHAVDRDRAELPKPLPADSRVRVETADIRHLSGAYDLIILRHPDVLLIRSGWNEAFLALARILGPEGTLFVSTFSPREHERALELISDGARLRVAFEGENETKTPNPPSDALHFRDKFVIIAHPQS